jgi:hypothetical protein
MSCINAFGASNFTPWPDLSALNFPAQFIRNRSPDGVKRNPGKPYFPSSRIPLRSIRATCFLNTPLDFLQK